MEVLNMDEEKSLESSLPSKTQSELTTSLSTPISKRELKTGQCPMYYEMAENGEDLNCYLDPNASRKKNKEAGLFRDLLCKLTGTNDEDLANEIISRSFKNIYGTEADKRNVILQSLADQQPRDAHEARLCAQATVLYSQAMKYLERAEKALDDGIFDKQGWNQIFMRNATRLLDLHTKTVEALIRYRQKGEQKIIVQHVNIEGGSQAILNNGNMVGGGGENKN